MAIIANTRVNWTVSPRIITIPIPITEVTVIDLQDTLTDLEDDVDGMSYPHLRNTSGGEQLGGGVTVGWTMELQNAQVQFEGRTTALDNGSVTTGDSEGRVLLDTTATFVTTGIVRGDTVFNSLTGSMATILTVDSETQLTTQPLTGGVRQDWQAADIYVIYHNEQCNISGGNLSAVDEDGNELKPTFESPNVNVVRTASSSATNSDLDAIQYSSYQGAAWYDETTSNTGTAYPNGNVEFPVNNLADAVAICDLKGFVEIRVVGNLTTDSITDDITDLHLVGISHINSVLDIGPDTICNRTRFSQFDLTGTLDGDSEIRNCVVRDLTYFNGHIHDSYLVGRITLAGNKPANIESCKILEFENPPIIDAGGTGQDLAMPNFSGLISFENLTGPSKMGIGLDAGQVLIDSTCTAGIIQVSGTGSVVDESGDACYVVDSVINGTDVQNLSRLIELQRPHHTGTGTIWFWDPYGGNDLWDGKHADRGTKTFAQAHALAANNNHDIIICVAGNPNGTTMTTEEIIITKNYLFVRGPGRDFHIHGGVDGTNTFDIQGNGVELSGFIATNNPTSSVPVIHASGNFPFIKDLYIEDSASGIQISDGAFGIIENTRVAHGTGYGIRVDGNSEHFTIRDSHIGAYTGNGLEIDITTGHEVSIEGDTIIHVNGGYGVQTSASTSGVILGERINVFGNTLGPIQDLAGDTHFTQLVTIDRQTSDIWNSPVSDFNASETFGGRLNRLNHLNYRIYVNTDLGVDGDGSQEYPYNNETSAIDHAEVNGITELVLYADIDLTRQVKNFLVTSTNIAKVDTGGQILTGSRFDHVELTGSYTGDITAQDCLLTGTNTNINGFFENCALSSSFEIPDGGVALLKDCTAMVTDFNKPILSVGGVGGTAKASIMGYVGGLTITNCNQITDNVKIISTGIVEIDASCTDGNIIVFGNVKPIDNSGVGCTVQWLNLNPEEAKDVHLAEFGRRRSVGLVDTIYEDDKITSRQVFDITKDGNGEVVEVDPR